ncbi:MAG: aquaporin [bacterium]|nr:aquaporin [bacterium]
MTQKQLKPLLTELIGTFLLTAVILFSINNPLFPIATPVLAAVMLGTFVYTCGWISGAHINPAITIGLASIGKIARPLMIQYIAAQMLGALLAKFFLSLFVVKATPMLIQSSATIGFAEALGAAVFAFGVAAVVFAKTPKSFSGVVVGSSLFIGISLAAIASLGVLNPAVAIGLGAHSIPYILGPIIGSVLGFNLYKYLSS